MSLSWASATAVSIVWIIHTCDTVTMRERPIGPESFVLLCLLLKMKSVELRQSERRLEMSLGVMLVLFLSVESESSLFLITLMLLSYPRLLEMQTLEVY